jgi:hypothetical protein
LTASPSHGVFSFFMSFVPLWRALERALLAMSVAWAIAFSGALES